MNNNFNRFLAFSSASLVGTLGLVVTAPSAKALTFILDFKESTQANTSDVFNIQVGSFDVTAYGFAEGQFDAVTNSVLDKVESHFYDIPTVSNYTGTTASPIPDGKELDIDFEIGDIGNLPSNGDTEYQYVQLGSFVSDPNNVLGGSTGVLGIAALGAVRTSSGTSPNASGFTVSSIFTDRIDTLVNPASGDLTEATNAIAGTLSHEIAHAVSLEHVYKESSETDGGVPPIMGTGALDLLTSDRLIDRAFSFEAFGKASSDNPEVNGFTPVIDGFKFDDEHEIHGDEIGDPFAPLADIPAGSPTLNNVSQLVSAVGTRDTASASVPFEFSPGMGLFLVGGTWGIASVRKKSQQKNQLKK